MGSGIPVMFFELCRLCLENAGEVNIFNTEDLVEDIFHFTSVKASVTDKLPTKICIKCLETIYNAKKLKNIALKNNFHLYSLFGEEDEDSTSESHETVENTLNKNVREFKKRFIFEEDYNHEKKDGKQNKDRKNPTQYNLNSSVLNVTKAISVRKDLFESTITVRSSTCPKDDAVISDIKSSQESSKRRLSQSDIYNKLKRSSSSAGPEDDTVISDTQSSRESSNRLSVDDNKLKCSVCQKTFETKKKFHIHMRNHDKKLYCPLDGCGKKFATKGDVERHIRTHTGEKPYKCEVCGKSFTQRGTLKAHRESLHGDDLLIIGK